MTKSAYYHLKNIARLDALFPDKVCETCAYPTSPINLLLLEYKSFNGLGPQYIADMLTRYKPKRSLDH